MEPLENTEIRGVLEEFGIEHTRVIDGYNLIGHLVGVCRDHAKREVESERRRIKTIIEDNKVSDNVVYDQGLPPADILPDMLHDIHIAREATNGTLDAILKQI